MDPMTQSDKISSSQGLADGQNAAKESKLSDSFLSSSPVSLIQSPQVKDLIHWRDPKKSGLVFGLSMLLLLSLAAFSFISVASYLLLALLCVTITFRIYKSVVQAVQKSNDGHPFNALPQFPSAAEPNHAPPPHTVLV
uniref:Reticulon n=1 Tax=Cyclopterus lumpus TaxID=8103 RepID=A0A8C3B0K8_CYCLU